MASAPPQHPWRLLRQEVQSEGHLMTTQESDVSKEVKAALEVDPRVDLHGFPIQVVHDGDGRVRLEGEVESIAAKRAAMPLAQPVSGTEPGIDALPLGPRGPRRHGENP